MNTTLNNQKDSVCFKVYLLSCQPQQGHSTLGMEGGPFRDASHRFAIFSMSVLLLKMEDAMFVYFVSIADGVSGFA